ncbi:YjgP/YjgQ family permease [Deinococcus metallilatus]|uniref:Lipopolysaccharide export system permease protein n=1 Tax=Deinococcus metallilatus TaxID=1211322 RepID=A0AAJ5F6C2_9DEIO|nr:LptF/LptG family permease [Deinococcus metallilatus]MBB5294473.1 lipopolysaccharide export system permease protein [Deinococcus metallilatus]QBY07527.1 YjgP/YjgQ family permease [Deinococcus metallilatus]RXJ13943.1 YjgP/YjgQ family permease [Deinococcus metallilatus]TLK29908.1 YjgP/YjgQ family permease [Deinococcus metallilatus]GMA15689.1 permease [Deinococcus metallilatus]
MRRFERYVLAEILPPLVGALAVVIVLLLLALLEGAIAPLLAKGANPLLVARLVALNIPEAVAQALPIALMFAALLGLSRLAADSEIKAALASGVPASRLFRPVLLLAAGVALVSFGLSEVLVTRAKVQAQAVQREIVLDNPRVIGLGARDGQSGGLVLRDALNRAISVGEALPGGELRDLRIVTMQAGLPPREVITARRGRLEPGSNVLELEDGQRVTFQNARPVTVLTFQRGTLPVQDVQASFDGGDASLKPIYLPLPDLIARTNTYRQQNVRAPADFTALHRKFAEPLAALALAFFVVSLAVFAFRSGQNLGLVWALLLSFAYYATWSVFRVMGENGAVPPALAAYAPDLIAVLAGVVLLGWASRR